MEPNLILTVITYSLAKFGLIAFLAIYFFKTLVLGEFAEARIVNGPEREKGK